MNQLILYLYIIKNNCLTFTNFNAMCTILNEGPVMQPDTQTSVRNGAANYGVSTVVAKHVEQDGDDHVFNIFDENGNYLFSIDTADNKPFDGQE